MSHMFPLPCEAGSTVPREGLDSSVIMPISWCCGCGTSYIVLVHIHCASGLHTPYMHFRCVAGIHGGCGWPGGGR